MIFLSIRYSQKKQLCQVANHGHLNSVPITVALELEWNHNDATLKRHTRG